MNAYLIELDHWSGQKLVFAVVADNHEWAIRQAHIVHGDKSTVTHVHDITTRGLAIYVQPSTNKLTVA